MNKPSTPTASLMLGYIWRAHQWFLDVADTNGTQYCAQRTTYFNHFLFLEIFLWISVSSKKRVGLFLILNKKTSLFRKVFLIFFENSTSVSFRLFLVGYNGCSLLQFVPFPEKRTLRNSPFYGKLYQTTTKLPYMVVSTTWQKLPQNYQKYLNGLTVPSQFEKIKKQLNAYSKDALVRKNKIRNTSYCNCQGLASNFLLSRFLLLYAGQTW